MDRVFTYSQYRYREHASRERLVAYISSLRPGGRLFV
jgi:hypothetical protein